MTEETLLIQSDSAWKEGTVLKVGCEAAKKEKSEWADRTEQIKWCSQSENCQWKDKWDLTIHPTNSLAAN